MKLKKMLVNGLKNPVGVDESPFFGWEISEEAYGSVQSAYRIVVSSSEEKNRALTGDLWDSGKVCSDASCDIRYEGVALVSKRSYWWTVQIWNQDGGLIENSRTETFSTGIFTNDEWKGCWIGAGSRSFDMENEELAKLRLDRWAPMLRKSFHAEGNVKRAMLYISGLGIYDVRINGGEPDDSVLNPGHTQYSMTVPYRTYDVTPLIRKGCNVIGVELGNGFMNEPYGVWNWEFASWRDNPKLLLNLELSYEDGHCEVIATDPTWKIYVDGPVLKNSIYMGEIYDARREVANWLLAEYDDGFWDTAKQMNPPQGRLVCQTMPPVRRIMSVPPKSITKCGPDRWLVMAPEMMSGWVRIRMKAAAGKTVTITYGERLEEDGSVPMIGKGNGHDGHWWPDGILQQDQYTSNGTIRFWEPKYSYKGYRYVQVDGYEETLTMEDVVCCCLANDIEVISDFDCSDAELVMLHKVMHRTLRNNFIWKPTDTPVYEKNGWLGDANVSLQTMLYQYDLRHFMANFENIMDDCFREFHDVPPIVPNADWNTENSPIWNTVYVFVAEALYDYYGQENKIKQLYPNLKAYALKNIEECKSYGWSWKDEQLSDWVSPVGVTDDKSVGSPLASEGASLYTCAFIYQMLGAMMRLAKVASWQQDIPLYQYAREQIYEHFQKNFYHSGEHTYQTNYWKDYNCSRSRYRQASNLEPLKAGLVPAEEIAGVVERLVQDIHEKDDHLDVGCLGTRLILPILTDHGHGDTAWRLLKQNTYPSWVYWLVMSPDGMDGAWEQYEFSGRSRDHYFLGNYDAFFFSHLCGIRSVRNSCRDVEISPVFMPALTYAGTKMKTIRGVLESGWRKNEDGAISLKVQIPQGVRARIFLPDGAVSIITGEQGILTQVRQENGETVITAVSGSYEFRINTNMEEKGAV